MKISRFFFFSIMFVFVISNSDAQNSDALSKIRSLYYSTQNQIKTDKKAESEWEKVYNTIDVHKVARQTIDGDDAGDLITSDYHFYFSKGKLNFVTFSEQGSDYQLYEEYLFDEKGQLTFYYYSSPLEENDIDGIDYPVQVRLYLSGNKAMKLSIKISKNEDGKYSPYLDATSDIPAKYDDLISNAKSKAGYLQKMFEMF